MLFRVLSSRNLKSPRMEISPPLWGPSPVLNHSCCDALCLIFCLFPSVWKLSLELISEHIQLSRISGLKSSSETTEMTKDCWYTGTCHRSVSTSGQGLSLGYCSPPSIADWGRTRCTNTNNGEGNGFCSQKTATHPSLENRCLATSCSLSSGRKTTKNSGLIRHAQHQGDLAATRNYPTPTWCKLVHCPQGSRRDGVSWTRVPLGCRERSPSCHRTSTLGKRALEETPRVIQLQADLQHFQEGQHQQCAWKPCPSALDVLPAIAKPEKAMPWWEWKNCPPFVKREATFVAQRLPSLLQSHSSLVPLAFQWDTFPFDQVLVVARPSGWHLATDQDPYTHLVLDFCNSPALHTDGKKKKEEFTV